MLQAHQKIELVIGETVDVTRIQEKADEVFGEGNSVVQIVEVFKDSVQITAKEISEEQKNNLVEKVNELYPQEATEEGKEPEKFTGKIEKRAMKIYKDRFKNDKEFTDLVIKLLDEYFSSKAISLA